MNKVKSQFGRAVPCRVVLSSVRQSYGRDEINPSPVGVFFCSPWQQDTRKSFFVPQNLPRIHHNDTPQVPPLHGTSTLTVGHEVVWRAVSLGQPCGRTSNDKEESKNPSFSALDGLPLAPRSRTRRPAEMFSFHVDR